MKQFILTTFLLLSSIMAAADTKFIQTQEGDHFVYFPNSEAQALLVVAHGMIGKNEKAVDVAQLFLSRWQQYANSQQMILIVPVFDTPRFGNFKGGYGGYRNLIGKFIGADTFINNLADKYSSKTSNKNSSFYLYGHSAGGQFVNRFTVRHPDRVINAVISAAGRYSYPTTSAKWPYGAGKLARQVTWADGSTSNFSFQAKLFDYARAAGKLNVVIGSNDTKSQAVRPAHIGKNRIEFARSWASAMNENAIKYNMLGTVSIYLVPGVGHNSAALTKKSAKILFANRH